MRHYFDFIAFTKSFRRAGSAIENLPKERCDVIFEDEPEKSRNMYTLK